MTSPGRDLLHTPGRLSMPALTSAARLMHHTLSIHHTVMRVLQSWLLVLLMTMTATTWAQGGRVTASLSASAISLDESVTLQVRAVNVTGSLDVSALEADFEVLGRSRSDELNIINGEQTRYITWAIELLPRAAGVFTVPPVQVGSHKSPLLSLTVAEAATGADRVLFVEAAVDEAEPYVQAQVSLTVSVFRAVDVLDGDISPPTGDDLVVERLGDDREYDANRDGRAYRVFERRYAVFPQASGTLTIDPVSLNATVSAGRQRSSSLFAPTRRFTRRSAPIELSVQPRPPAFQGDWWLPASDVQLSANWVQDPSMARVDQPLTRRIQLRARGVSEIQLPTIEPVVVNGASVYPESVDATTVVEGDGLLATLDLVWAVLPERTGELVIPPLKVYWFDTDTAEAAVAELPAEVLTVMPRQVVAAGEPAEDVPATALAGGLGRAAASPAESPAPPSVMADDTSVAGVDSGAVAAPDKVSRSRTLLLTGVAAAVLLLVILVGYHRRRLWRLRQPDEALRRGVREAPPTASRAVLTWAATRWPLSPPQSLPALASRLENPQAKAALAALDAAVYRPASGPVGGALESYEQLGELLPACVGQMHRAPGENSRQRRLPAL